MASLAPDQAGVKRKRTETSVSPPNEQRTALDAVDSRLVAALQRDARTSIRGLSREVGMSAGAISERLERLETRGIIRGYTIDVDPAALGFGMEVLIGIQTNQHRGLHETVTDLMTVTEVAQVQLVTGRWDLVVRLQLRDHEHLREVLLGEIWQMPDFQHSESMIVLQSFQPRGPTPTLPHSD